MLQLKVDIESKVDLDNRWSLSKLKRLRNCVTDKCGGLERPIN